MSSDILIIDDEADIRNLIAGILEDEGYKTAQAENATKAFEHLRARNFSMVVLDIWLQNSEFDGLEILERIKRDYADLPVVMISGHGTIETAVKAIKMGAYDFIEKPFKTDRLLMMVTRALETAALRRENASLRRQTQEAANDMVGDSLPVQSLRQLLDKIATTNSRVMISGPAGAGKEVAARYIHAHSARAKGPFIALNCASLNPERLEQELFGQDSPGQVIVGVLERADGGTLLLDEVADMPMETQAKILRVLQDQSFTHIGGKTQIGVDVRILASTSRNLEDKIAEGKFREDLFYRLNVVPVVIPPLRERRDDIALLVTHFMTQISNQSGARSRSLSDGAMAAFLSYSWPGNVRQLKNLVEWMMILGGGQETTEPIQTADLPPEIADTMHATLKGGEWQADMVSLPLREAREVFEREYLLAQINRFGGNVSRTAQFVGMERSALHRKLKSLHIATSDREDAPDYYDRNLKAVV